MTDSQIIALYFIRDQRAISETAASYGSYCYQIAYNILSSREDSEECVDDAYMTAWNHIPPTKPSRLQIYLGRITRNLSIDRWRSIRAAKRGSGQLDLAIEELDRTLAGGQDPEEIAIRGELKILLREFLKTLPDTERRVFLCRYWYLDSVGTIAGEFGFSVSKVKSMLLRTRRKLKKYLLEGGYEA